MPRRITIDTLHIDDSQHPENFQGPTIFANFNRSLTDASHVEKFPYVRTEGVILRNVTTASGEPLRISDNPFMLREVQVRTIPDE